MKYITLHETVAEYNAVKLSLDLPQIAAIEETNEVKHIPLSQPTGQTPTYCVTDNISTASTAFTEAYNKSDGKWYKRNNLNEYEEYGVYEEAESWEDLEANTTKYEGKLAIVPIEHVENQYDEFLCEDGHWGHVGTYGIRETAYTITEETFQDFSGQPIVPHFKIPKSDIDNQYEYFSMYIYLNDGMVLQFSKTSCSIIYRMTQTAGTVTHDDDYYYYNIDGVADEYTINWIMNYSGPGFDLIMSILQIDEKYPTIDPPLAAVSFKSMLKANEYENTYYGLVAHIEDIDADYVFTSGDTWEMLTPATANYLKLKAIDTDTTYSFTNNAVSGSLYVSYDLGNSWNELGDGERTLTTQKGTTVMFKGDLYPSETQEGHDGGVGILTSSAPFDAEGNPMSLIYDDEFTEQENIDVDYAFYKLFFANYSMGHADKLELSSTVLTKACYTYMFSSCSMLQTFPSLPATTLAEGCYEGMFASCSQMRVAPSLPATTMAKNCYKGMFIYCAQLATAPQLPSTTLAEGCYNDMFNYCQALTEAPSLPATTLAKECYRGMFESCSSLRTAPQLPATIMAEGCYAYMFDKCSALTTVPSLPATTLAKGCYEYMFSGCDGLTTVPQNMLLVTTLAVDCYAGMLSNCNNLTTAPSLPATTLAEGCYASMFFWCSSLTDAPSLPATTLAARCYQSMFQECTALSGAPSSIGDSTTVMPNSACSNMFSSCGSLTTAPSLPATTLGNHCYEYMFSNCYSITTAPTLSAATLEDYCYSNMFAWCNSLNSVTCLATDISAEGCTEWWLNGVAESGTFTREANTVWGEGESGIPYSWTVSPPYTSE